MNYIMGKRKVARIKMTISENEYNKLGDIIDDIHCLVTHMSGPSYEFRECEYDHTYDLLTIILDECKTVFYYLNNNLGPDMKLHVDEILLDAKKDRDRPFLRGGR